MSVDNIAFDLNRLTFDTTPDLLSNKNNPLLATRSNYPNNNNSTPSITITQEKRTLRSKDRNRQCVPSDDEDDDEDELESSDEEDNVGNRPLGKSNPITASTTVKPKLRQPLPSDDEEDEEEDDDDDSDVEQHQQSSPVYRRLSGIGSTSNLHQGRSPTPQLHYQQDADMAKRHSDGAGNSGNQYYCSNNEYEYNRHNTDEQPIQQPQFHFQEGTQLHHLQQMQQHHQSQIAQFQYQQQQSSFLRPQQQQQQRVSMSGMDLLKQLEQEKAEAKRQKPNFNSSKVKIDKGLLANVPEPGSHNISFQQMAMQQQQQHHHHHHHHHHNNGHHHASKPRHQRSASSLEKQQRQQHHQQPPPQQQQQYGYYPAHAVAAAPVGYMYPQQQVYPYLNTGNGNGLMASPSFNGSSQSLVMMDNHHLPSRPGSALSNSSRRRSQD